MASNAWRGFAKAIEEESQMRHDKEMVDKEKEAQLIVDGQLYLLSDFLEIIIKNKNIKNIRKDGEHNQSMKKEKPAWSEAGNEKNQLFKIRSSS